MAEQLEEVVAVSVREFDELNVRELVHVGEYDVLVEVEDVWETVALVDGVIDVLIDELKEDDTETEADPEHERVEEQLPEVVIVEETDLERDRDVLRVRVRLAEDVAVVQL